MSEPEIVIFGRHYIDHYPVTEYIDCFIRAFRDGRADYIILDSNMRGQRFLAASVAWAIDNGWLYWDQTHDDRQCAVFAFRLTDEGKRNLL